MSAVAATLRIARRDALRARGRSALVVAMIGLPVLGVSAVSVLVSTYALTPDQQRVRQLGQADAAWSDSGMQRVEQSAGSGFASEQTAPRTTPVDLQATLPAGARGLMDTSRSGVASAGGDAPASVALRELAYDDPLAAGLYTPVSGRAPDGPSEVALTTGLADRLSVGVGGSVVLDRTGPARTVVGLVEDAGTRRARTVLLDPGTMAPLTTPDPFGASTSRLLVDVPGGLVWSQVLSANAVGVYVDTAGRPVPGAPAEPPLDSGNDVEAVTAVALVVGMALLEVVLLAGPAFAVGAKRSRRQLALLAATGAERADVRRTVLGGGLVLGAVGGVLGLVGGLALARAGLPVIGRFDDGVPGPFEVVPWQLAVIAVVGVGTALLAALLPARAAARQDVVASLTGRAGPVVASGRLVPLLGLVAVVAGALVALQGARSRSVALILAGSVVAELGLVAMTPTLVGAAGALGPWLPVAGRLALRDASRNRSRTAPAVSAILAAVAGTVAVGTFLVSQDRAQQQTYSPSGVLGSAVVPVYGPGLEVLPQVVAALRRDLPAAEVLVVRSLAGGGDGRVDEGYVEVRPVRGCESGATRCASYSGTLSGPLVGDAALVTALTGASDPALARALQAGGAVVPADYLQPDGTALLVDHPPGDVEGTAGVEVRVPAVALPADAFGTVVLSPRAAALVDRPVRDVGAAVVTTRTPTEREQARASDAVQQLAPGSAVYVERGYTSDTGPTLLALAGLSALLVLGASGIATGLAAADGRADLSTLASVGATPGLRRRLAGSQSLVTALLGTVLGTVAGLVPAYAFIGALNEPDSTGFVREVPFPFVVPWSLLGVTAVVVPLVAALAAVLLTRSRLPLVRRLV